MRKQRILRLEILPFSFSIRSSLGAARPGADLLLWARPCTTVEVSYKSLKGPHGPFNICLNGARSA